MKIPVSIKGLDALTKDINKLAKQLPFATKNTLNDLAFDVRRLQTAQMRAKMGRPLPLRNSSVFHVEKATKKTLAATVSLNDGTFNRNGINYVQKIGHLFTGGKRGHKAGEGRLYHGGYMKSGEMYVFGQEAPLTKGGYITGGTMNKIFASARVKGRNIGVTNTAARVRRGRPKKGQKSKRLGKKGYFVVGNNRSVRAKHLKRGIYKRDKADLLPVLIFTGDGSYKPMFNLEKMGRSVVKKNLEKHFRKNIKAALKTAR